MLAPPPRSTFLAKNHCKLQGILKPPHYLRHFWLWFSMLFFLLQRCLKLLEDHGACIPIVCQPPCARTPFILFVSACASAAPARHDTWFVSERYTVYEFPTPRRGWPSTCNQSSPTGPGPCSNTTTALQMQIRAQMVFWLNCFSRFNISTSIINSTIVLFG